MLSPIIDKLRPEMSLLLYCASPSASQETREGVRELLASPLNWDTAFAEANRHSLLPLVDRQLRRLGNNLVPVPVMQLFQEASHTQALRCLNQTAALIEIVDLFRAAGITALPYKGPVLAVQAYGEVTLRQFDDVDVIVRHQDVEKAHAIMGRLRYTSALADWSEQSFNSHPIPGEYKYCHKERELIAELHTERTLRHFPVAPGIDELWRRGTDINLSGHNVWTLSLEDTLVAICVHGSKDLWSRLLWIADVSELIRARTNLDWAEVFRQAESLCAERMVCVGLILAARLLNAPLPETVSLRLKKDRLAQRIAEEFEMNLLLDSSNLLGPIARFHLRRRLVPGFFNGWRYSLRLTMAPAEEDWNITRLPRYLARFYFLLRPFRLLRKYSQVNAGR